MQAQLAIRLLLTFSLYFFIFFYFSIADGSIEPTKYGLRIEIRSLSPFVVSWETKEPQVTPTATPAPTPQPTATPLPAEALPKTGDAAPLGAAAALLVCSAAIFVLLVSKRRSA